MPNRCNLEPEENLHHILIPGDGNCVANRFAVHFEENIDKVLDKLDTKFLINLQNYRQFSECSTEKIREEVYNHITMKKYNNNTADIILYTSANTYQTKVIVSHAGTDTRYSVGVSYSQTIHLCKNEDPYDLLTVIKEQETATANFDDPQVVEDGISENCNIIGAEW